MSLASSVSTLAESGRRFEARRRVDCLVYVDFGADNGAILIDLGEGGLGFQSILPVSMDLALPVKFKLSGETNPIEGYAEVAWVNESGTGGGLRFVTLSADGYAQIREWTDALAAPEARAFQAAKGSASNSAPTRAAERASANSVQQSTTPQPTAPELTKREDAPARISEAFARVESAQVAATSEVPSGDQLTGEQAPADPGVLLVPESFVPVLSAADSTEPLALPVDSVSSATSSTPPHEPERKIDDGVEATASPVANLSPEASDAPSIDELTGEHDPADLVALVGTSVVSESSVQDLPTADSSEPLALPVDSASAETSIPATSAAESNLPREPELKIHDGVEATASSVAEPSPETSDAPSADEPTGEQAPADLVALPESSIEVHAAATAADTSALPGASLVLDPSVHVLPAEDSTEPLALQVDLASPPSVPATSPESAAPLEPEPKIEDVEAAASPVAELSPETSEPPLAEFTVAPADSGGLPSASLALESFVPDLPGAHSMEPLALLCDSGSFSAPSNPGGTPESALPHEPECKIDDGLEALASQVAESSPETSEAPLADELTGEQTQAEPSALPSPTTESSVQDLPTADSTEPLALPVDSASSAEPSIPATSAAESNLPPEPELKIDDGVEATAEAAVSVEPTTDTSEVPKTVRIKPNVAGQSSLEIEPRIQSAPASELPAARTREVTFGFSTQAPATAARATRVPAPDSRNFVSVQKLQRRPTKPESPLPPANDQDSSGRGSRHVCNSGWETLPPDHVDESKSKWMLAPRPLKFWIGAATGFCLVLALFVGIPSVRTRVQATTSARSGGSSLASVPTFQVEVVDLSNRRWMLRSAGQTGWPFTNTPSRRERPPEASSSPRTESTKPTAAQSMPK